MVGQMTQSLFKKVSSYGDKIIALSLGVTILAVGMN